RASSRQVAEAAERTGFARARDVSRTASEVAEEVRLSEQEYRAALRQVFPGQFLEPVARLVDEIGERAAQRAVSNPQFIQAVRNGNWKVAGTLFPSAAAQEARAVPAAALPRGWSLQAELVIQPGAGGSRADLFLRGPAGELVEFDWKTSAASA